jgi:hypothetical protein
VGVRSVNRRIIRGKETIRRRFLRWRREKNNNWKEKKSEKEEFRGRNKRTIRNRKEEKHNENNSAEQTECN